MLSPLHWSSDSFDSEGQVWTQDLSRYRDRVETKLNRLRQLDNSDRQSQQYILSVTYHSGFNRIWQWFMAPFQFSSELQHTRMLHDNHLEAFFFDSPFNKKLVPHHNLRTTFLGEEYFANPLHRLPPLHWILFYILNITHFLVRKISQTSVRCIHSLNSNLYLTKLQSSWNLVPLFSG